MTIHSPKSNFELPDFRKQKKPETFLKILAKSLGILVGAVFLIFFIRSFFGLIAVENYPRPELFAQFRGGNEGQKLKALQEWARHLSDSSYLPTSPESDVIFSAIGENQAEQSSFKLLQQLGALILGSSPHSLKHRDWLLEQLKSRVNEDDPKWHQAFFWSLGQFLISDQVGTQGLDKNSFYECIEAYLKSTGPEARSLLAFFLSGLLSSKQAADDLGAEKLMRSLEKLSVDESKDVRANAAIALLKRGNLKAKESVKILLNESTQISLTGLPKGEQVESVLTQDKAAFYFELYKASSESGDLELRALVESISKSHPNVKLREFARKSLSP